MSPDLSNPSTTDPPTSGEQPFIFVDHHPILPSLRASGLTEEEYLNKFIEALRLDCADVLGIDLAEVTSVETYLANRELYGLDRLLEALRKDEDEDFAASEDQIQTPGLEDAQVGKYCTSS